MNMRTMMNIGYAMQERRKIGNGTKWGDMYGQLAPFIAREWPCGVISSPRHIVLP